MTTPGATASDAWRGDFGKAYTERNRVAGASLDALYLDRYGSTRSALNAEFLGGLPISSVLEVGCNVGAQLRLLRLQLQARLAGIDVQEAALRSASEAMPGADLRCGDASRLPWPDASFDLVFTSGVLIHVPPAALATVMDEMLRVSRRWIWGLEYWNETPVEVAYRGHAGLLWKRDFRAAWQERFPHLHLVRERRLPHRDGSGLADSMFLLEKR